MSNNYHTGLQWKGGLQPAIPFQRPPQASTSRTRTETPIHPPQIPPARTQLPQQQRQQTSYPTQLQHPDEEDVRQIAQLAQHLHAPEGFSHPQQDEQQHHQQQDGEAPPPMFHRITPGQKPRTREQIIIDAQLEDESQNQAPHLAHHREQQTRRHIELDQEQIEALERQSALERAQNETTRALAARKPTPRKPRPRKGQQNSGATQGQQSTSTQPRPQTQPITIPDDDDDDDGDAEMEDEGNGNGNGNAGGDDNDSLPEEEGPWIAPLIQPITPLKLPTVRPTLRLGPYDCREDCLAAAQEYAIKQGYVLISMGYTKSKVPDGNNPNITQMDLKCDRGGICKNAGTGLRRRKTYRLGCPARIKLVKQRRYGDKWFIGIICEEHNHDLDPNNIDQLPAYRRWKRSQEGKPGRESHQERLARLRKAREAEREAQNQYPNPEQPQIHQTGIVQPTEKPTSPIHLAALKGQYRILEILLDNGGEVNGKDAYGRTPLHCAVEGQKMDCVTLLVDRGADVRILNNRGVSALHLAVEKGMEDAVVMFIERGADPNRLAFYLTPELLSLCDELKKERQMSARRAPGRPRNTA